MITLQPDGKVIIGGAFTTFNGNPQNRIARLNGDGTLDASFNVGTGFNNTVYSIAVQPNGKVLVGGVLTNYNGTARNRLVRLNADGSLDTNFVSGFDAVRGYVRRLFAQTDRKILIGGDFSSYNGAARNSVLRLMTATFIVTNTNDGGAGSLRQAILDANATTDDTITFNIAACPNGICTITLTTGELAINAASTGGRLTITNATAANRLLISGNNTSRVFYLNPGANLTINGVTITKGNGTGVAASGFGGGIFNNGGILTLTNSTVSGNTGTSGGGGIYIASGTTTLTNSTVSGNTAQFGGGIANNGTLNLTSVTVTWNSSPNTTCTICAGGIANFAGRTANLKNTIVAGNTAANAASSPDFGGAVAVTSSYNLIGNGQGTTGITNGVNNNQIGTNTNPLDARFTPLGNYGGATQTHALLSNSPAINNGTATDAPTIDQRGANRVGNVDIGAFELNDSNNGGGYQANLPTTSPSQNYNVVLAQYDEARFPNLTYSITNGRLPNGVSLTQTSSLAEKSSGGSLTNNNQLHPETTAAIKTIALTGTPTQSGTFNFTITSSDGANTNNTNYSLVVLSPEFCFSLFDD